MNDSRSTSKSVPVLAAAALVIILAGTLGARLVSHSGRTPAPVAPGAVVPAPAMAPIGDLEIPCWSCPEAKKWAIRFQTDLDLLAPLGNGSANAAVWFADFEKRVGPRAAEVISAMKRRVEGPEWIGKVFPPDDPLLAEAEPWCDQATMRFYPEFFELEGPDTRITNLLLPLNLVRSWVARGMAAEDSVAAMADFRRAIRLGRLLRQEDVVIINDLVGLACIHIGARGVYRRALADGDLELALLASAALGEVAPQRLRTSENTTRTDLSPSLREGPDGGITLQLHPEKLDVLIEAAKNAPDRRFRAEAMIGLSIVRALGSPDEQRAASEVLADLAISEDEMIVTMATWSRDNQLTEAQLREWMAPPPIK
jgi:hypothetical protein